MARRALIHVQTLLGSGHLVRAARIARALGAAGIEAHLVTGGGRVAEAELGQARLHALPFMRAADQSFSRLIDETGREIDDDFRARRADLLLALFDAIAPDLLVTELYPFGRRQCAFELNPLLEAAWAHSPRPLVACSLRDILHSARKPGRAEEALALFDRRYDLALVHGDPRLVRLEESFPLAAQMGERLRYTGYVAPQAPTGAHEGSGEVVVSAGGSGVGLPLLRAAVAARKVSRLSRRRWRILTGAGIDAEAAKTLGEGGGPRLIVEPARPDFLGLLAAAQLSVSQAGYNTVMDVLTARTRAVLVPFEGEGETEQMLRARRLAEKLPGIAMVAERELSSTTLAAAIDAVADRPAPDPAAIGLEMSGAASTARLLASALAGRA